MEKININKFSFLSKNVDSCIDLFLSGASPDECVLKIKDLSKDYSKKLKSSDITDLLEETQTLFLTYLNLLNDFNYLIEIESYLMSQNKYDINSYCMNLINIRNRIINSTTNMASNYFFQLEKEVIIKLQEIGRRYNLYEEKENNIKNR